MSKFFKLLISTLMCLGLSVAQAVEADEGAPESHFSGFITGTAFSNTSFYNSTHQAAINFNFTKELWAIRGQVAAPSTHMLRRLVLERSFFIGDKNDLVVQIGRFPRLDSLYNNVTDAPSSSGTAILPLGSYNRRMLQNYSFTALDGIQLLGTHRLNDFILKLHADYGVPPAEKQCEIQLEAFPAPCSAGFSVSGARGNYDYGVTVFADNMTFLLYRGKLSAKTTLLNPQDPVAAFASAYGQRLHYTVNKASMKYEHSSNWWAEAEFSHNVFHVDPARVPPILGDTVISGHLNLGVEVNEHINAYASFSKGKLLMQGTNQYDRVLGATYTRSHSTFSLEYHKGSGNYWTRITSTAASWNSWVASFTQTF